MYIELILAKDLKYISEEQLLGIKEQVEVIGKLINGMRRRQLQRLHE